jgi:hypothetical protein
MGTVKSRAARAASTTNLQPKTNAETKKQSSAKSAGRSSRAGFSSSNLKNRNPKN